MLDLCWIVQCNPWTSCGSTGHLWRVVGGGGGVGAREGRKKKGRREGGREGKMDGRKEVGRWCT